MVNIRDVLVGDRAPDEHQVLGMLPFVIITLLTYDNLIKSNLSAYLAGSIEKPSLSSF